MTVEIRLCRTPRPELCWRCGDDGDAEGDRRCQWEDGEDEDTGRHCPREAMVFGHVENVHGGDRLCEAHAERMVAEQDKAEIPYVIAPLPEKGYPVLGELWVNGRWEGNLCVECMTDQEDEYLAQAVGRVLWGLAQAAPDGRVTLMIDQDVATAVRVLAGPDGIGTTRGASGETTPCRART